jgi:hypothetical protein
VPMLPSALYFSLVSADVPVVTAGQAPPSMAPLCRVRYSEERKNRGDVAIGGGECARVASEEGEDPTVPVQLRHGHCPC